MPYTMTPTAEPEPLNDGLTSLIEQALRTHTQWNPAYENAAIASIREAVMVLLGGEDSELTADQVNVRIEGMRATLYILRIGLEISGEPYQPGNFIMAP